MNNRDDSYNSNAIPLRFSYLLFGDNLWGHTESDSDETECELCLEDEETVGYIFATVVMRIRYITFRKVDPSLEDLRRSHLIKLLLYRLDETINRTYLASYVDRKTNLGQIQNGERKSLSTTEQHNWANSW